MLKLSHTRSGYLVLQTEDDELPQALPPSMKLEVIYTSDRHIKIGYSPGGGRKGSKWSKTNKVWTTSIICLKPLPKFGRTPIPADRVVMLDQGFSINLEHMELVELKKFSGPMVKKRAPTPVELPQVGLSLKECIVMVNHHKDRLGDDLCLSIDEDGRLRALIQY